MGKVCGCCRSRYYLNLYHRNLLLLANVTAIAYRVLTQELSLQVWRHNLQSDQSSDTCIYHEKDVEHWLDLGSSESDKYLLVTSASKITQFVLFLDKKNPDGELEYLSPRVDGVDISVAHARNHFFITRRSEETYNSELLVSPIEDRSAPVVLLPHRPRYICPKNFEQNASVEFLTC